MDTEIDKTVLQKLYEKYFQGESGFSLHEIRQTGGWDETTFWKAADRMSDKGTIEAAALGGQYRITAPGILYAEREGIVSEEWTRRNDKTRTAILEALWEEYEQHGNLGGLHFRTISVTRNMDSDDILLNMEILENADYVQSHETGIFSITHHGLDAIEEWKAGKGLESELDRITGLNPQARGRELQKLFARVVERNGWSQEEGVRTSHEEMDVIVFRAREYYLIECKWEKDPIEASVIRELLGKLTNRVDVRGIVVSMSGFTTGAKEQAEQYAGQRVILLFGPGDVESMIRKGASFEDSLDAKHKELIMRRRTVFS